jgi:hypothetical protein
MFSTLGGNELSALVGLGGGILLGLAARMGDSVHWEQLKTQLTVGHK